MSKSHAERPEAGPPAKKTMPHVVPHRRHKSQRDVMPDVSSCGLSCGQTQTHRISLLGDERDCTPRPIKQKLCAVHHMRGVYMRDTNHTDEERERGERVPPMWGPPSSSCWRVWLTLALCKQCHLDGRHLAHDFVEGRALLRRLRPAPCDEPEQADRRVRRHGQP